METLVLGFQTADGPPFGNCAPRVGSLNEVVAQESPRFVRSLGKKYALVHGTLPRGPTEGVHSIVYVTKGANLARDNVAAARDRNALGCVARLRAREARGRFIDGEPYKRGIKVSSLFFPVPSVAGYGFRVSGTVAGAAYREKKRLPFYEDTFGVAVGSSEIVLHADSIVRPVSSAEEGRLLSLLYDRAKARPL
jgi:hypothetical protein